MNALDHLAPFPESADEATADRMAGVFAAYGQLHLQIALNHPDADQRAKAEAQFTTYWAMVALLRALMGESTAAADSAAREIWTSWQDAAVMVEDLRRWQARCGINPDRVNAVAAQVCTPNPLAGTQAGTESAA